MIDKIVPSVESALAGVSDGSTVLVGGFGGAGVPEELIHALIARGAQDPTIVNNKAGNREVGIVALVKAERGDRWGNLVYRKSARNYGPTMSSAAKLTIAQVYELVELGGLDPECIVTPGIFVTRVVKVPRKGGAYRAPAGGSVTRGISGRAAATGR